MELCSEGQAVAARSSKVEYSKNLQFRLWRPNFQEKTSICYFIVKQCVIDISYIMQYRFFTIPAFDSEAASDELNRFIRTHRVLDMQQKFVPAQNGAYWYFSIKYIQGDKNDFYQDKKEKTDYRKLLDKDTFDVFEKLREYRKKIAEDDAVPAYAVFTDAELSEIAKLKEITEQQMKKIKGIGEKKTGKYGNLLSEMFQANKDSIKTGNP